MAAKGNYTRTVEIPDGVVFTVSNTEEIPIRGA
jgi:ribosomal protein L6P/L9E